MFMKILIYFWIIFIWFYVVSSNYSWNHIYWIMIIVLWFYLIFNKLIWAIIKSINNKLSLNRNQNNTNCEFDFKLNILEILNDKKLEEYFDSSCFEKNNKLHTKIIKNWKKLIKDWRIKQEIILNIKNWNIYKNWKIDFADTFFYEIFIPYNLNTYNEKDYNSMGWITIRIVVINWILKLQLWNFLSSWDFNKIYTDSIWDTYQNFYDLVKIPIIYYFYYFNISRKHLNIVPQWIEWYYNSEWKMFSEKWKKQWRQLNIDLDNYSYLSWLEDDTLDKRYDEITNDFLEKANNILENQNIIIDNNDDDIASNFNLWHATSFIHKYLTLEVYDFNYRYEEYYKINTCWYIKDKLII